MTIGKKVAFFNTEAKTRHVLYLPTSVLEYHSLTDF